MRAILAINAAARAKGMSYGHFVVISTAAELREIVGRFRGPEDGDLSTASRSKGEAKDAAGQGAAKKRRK